ncbi:MAG: crossover junction endodeoxyribonuclease RuvC [Bacteroidota bacterium]|nr:crossover junction endodeoxyribonuclease RuvC [Bacteroidota bacterium]
MNNSKIILGIDPGTIIMGYGLIKVENNSICMLAFGELKLGKYGEQEVKLKKIYDRVTSLIDEFNVDELAIEAPFFGKNVQSMLKLGRAQGVAIAAALSRSLSINEYSPRKIKQSITGNGSASKEQVALMLKNLKLIEELPENLDATDGLAAAVCHHYQSKCSAKTVKSESNTHKRASGWKAFLTENPDRIY